MPGLSRNTDFVSRQVSGETIVLPVKSGVASTECVFTLNEVGSLIWSLIDGVRAAEDIALEVSRQFEVTPDEARADVSAFLADLVEAGLVAAPEEMR